MNRKLRLESLEDRRLLAGMGDHVFLDIPDDGEPVDHGPPADIDVPPEMVPPFEDADWIRPIPQEARHFIARLRPVDGRPLDPSVDPPTDPPQGDAPTTPEGESHPEIAPPDHGMPHAGGIARFFLNQEESLLRFRLRVPFVPGVTSADVHLGSPEDGGPTVATLFSIDGGSINGLFIRGELSGDAIEPNNEADFDGTLASLVQRMRDGDTYVEVHSSEHPDGALRGTIHPLSWRPWQNPVNRMDVNGDRDVTPRDLLTIVGDMNDRGARLADIPVDENAPLEPPSVDVTGDNVISPRDALALVEYLTQYGEDLLNQVGVPPEAVSDTLEELQQALQIDQPQTIAEIEDRVAGILSDNGVDIDSLLDKVSETFEQQYRERFSEWIGQADEIAQQMADQFSGISRDWPGLFDEAFQDEGGPIDFGNLSPDGLAMPSFLGFAGGAGQMKPFGGRRR